MDRRDFLKQSSLASSLFFVPNFVKNIEYLSSQKINNKKLVIIQLSGGNDGLNTIIPYTNDIYYRSRPKLSIKKNNLLKVTDYLGFHESLQPLKNLYDQGYLSIINNVGYPNPNRSHFRSTDIWQTASGSKEHLTSGWVGRFLEQYNNNPYAAIELDDSLSLIMKGEKKNGIATKNARILYHNTNTPFFSKILKNQTEEHLSEHNLGYLYKTMIDAKSSAKYIYETTKTYKTSQEYPNNAFGNQLKTTAEFINSNLDTKVYYISMGGFDTHVNQNIRHKKLLEVYSSAIEVFINDLKKNDTFKDTLILTFSEFGRRVKQNAAGGTDHGAANNVFIMGENLNKKGIYNEAPNLSNLDKNGDLIYKIDFREIYATILNNWLNVNENTILNNSFNKLNFI